MAAPILLILAFAVTALAYALVGFGGGSTYNALLVLADVDYRLVPAIALTCNILVVAGGVYHFHRAGQLHPRSLLPFVLTSIPFAWLGGRVPISEQTFVGLLGLSLLVAAAQLMIQPPNADNRGPGTRGRWRIGLPLGAGIGLLSGMVGIGGGIFLAPVLNIIGWARPREIAAIASAFILVNSVSGLTGQLMKQGEASPLPGWVEAWPLFLAVVVGGQIGSRIGARRLPQRWVRGLTAILVLYVALRLLWRWWEIVS